MSHLRPFTGGSGRWVLQLICCGYDDGQWRCRTWEEADALRESYTAPHPYWTHERSAILSEVTP